MTTLTRWLDQKRCHLRVSARQPTPQLANQRGYNNEMIGANFRYTNGKVQVQRGARFNKGADGVHDTLGVVDSEENNLQFIGIQNDPHVTALTRVLGCRRGNCFLQKRSTIL